MGGSYHDYEKEKEYSDNVIITLFIAFIIGIFVLLFSESYLIAGIISVSFYIIMIYYFLKTIKKEINNNGFKRLGISYKCSKKRTRRT